MTEYLTLENVSQLHDALIEEFGGLRGMRDINLLCSAVEMPKTTMFSHELYVTIFDKAAVYLYHIIQNHPFNDANKRTGAAAAYLFLEINNTPILFDEDDDSYEQLIIEVAQGKRMKEEISHFFEYGKISEHAF